MSEFKWQLVPVEPTREMCLAARRARSEYPINENADSPVVTYRAMLAAAPQPPAHELLASLERFESDGEDFVKLHDVHDAVAMIKQPPALGGEPVAALQFKCVGDRNPSDWSDVRGSLQLEQMQRTNELCEARDRPACYEFRELVDRAHVDRLQAEVERLKIGSRTLAELDDQTVKHLGDKLRVSASRNAALEGLLREAVSEPFMNPERRKRIDAALAEGAPITPCAHEWTDDGQFLLVCTKCSAQQDHDPHWRDPDTAPKNGTMLRLLVEFTDHSTEDDDKAITIGHNSRDNTDEDEWQFAGWCWSHDHYTEGKGAVVGWLPLMDDKAEGAKS